MYVMQYTSSVTKNGGVYRHWCSPCHSAEVYRSTKHRQWHTMPPQTNITENDAPHIPILKRTTPPTEQYYRERRPPQNNITENDPPENNITENDAPHKPILHRTTPHRTILQRTTPPTEQYYRERRPPQNNITENDAPHKPILQRTTPPTNQYYIERRLTTNQYYIERRPPQTICSTEMPMLWGKPYRTVMAYTVQITPLQ